MKLKFTTAMQLSARNLLVMFTLSYFSTTAQQFNWVRSIGGSTATSFQVDMDKVEDVAIDKWGNTFVVGITSANPKVNGVSNTFGNYGLQDGYVAKFDRCGNLEWMRIMGKNQSDLTSGVAVDNAGNCYVTGWVSQGQFTSPCKDTSFPVNSLNSFIAKYDGSGCMKWIRVLDGIGAYPKPRNIKMRSDGKLCVWMNCQPKPAPVIDSIVVTSYSNLFMRMDTNGVIDYHKFVDAGSTNLASFQLEENNNLCLYYSHGDGFNPTTYSIAGQTFALDIDGSLLLRLDSDFEYLSHEQNYKAQILGYETDNGKIYAHAILQKGAYFGEDTFTTIKARFNYQEVLRSSDLNFQKLALSQPDTQRNAQIGTQDLCISGDYIYLTLTNSAGYMKWSNIDLLNFGSMVPTIGVLVRFNKHTLVGELLDTIYGYRAVSGFDITKVMERDRQGNIYMAGLFAGALYLGGDTVTPNGGGGSPDGFLTRWGLPCTDTTDALIAPDRPLSLVATATGAQQISVQWQDAAQYELGYELYRSIGDTLQWVKTDSLPRNTQSKTDGNVQQSIVYWYKVRAFNSGGKSSWSNADSAMIVAPNIQPTKPVINVSPGNEICPGQSATLKVSNPCSGCTYTWTPGNQTGDSIQVNAQGSYIAVATNASGDSSSLPIVITVLQSPTLPLVTVSPSAAFCQGDTATLTVSNPCSGCDYSWLPDAQTGNSIQVAASNSYSVNASNNCGQLSSNPVNITVHPLPPSPAISINGNQLTSSAASGNQWYLDSSLIGGAVQQTFIAQQSGNYHVVVTDSNNCSAQSGSVSITVTGISGVEAKLFVAVYPNPTTGDVNVQFADGQKNVSVEVFDVTGKLALKQKLNNVPQSHIYTFSIANLPNGVYHLRLNANGSFNHHRLVLTK